MFNLKFLRRPDFDNFAHLYYSPWFFLPKMANFDPMIFSHNLKEFTLSFQKNKKKMHLASQNLKYSHLNNSTYMYCTCAHSHCRWNLSQAKQLLWGDHWAATLSLTGGMSLPLPWRTENPCCSVCDYTTARTEEGHSETWQDIQVCV